MITVQFLPRTLTRERYGQAMQYRKYYVLFC